MSQSSSSPTTSGTTTGTTAAQQPTQAAPVNNDAQSTLVTNRPTDAPVANQPNQPQSQESEQQLFESAKAEIKRLTDIKNKLVKDQEHANKEIAKIQHRTRIESLKSIVPRVLFHHEDTYINELERISQWRNVPDEDIAAIYQAKMMNIDAGKTKGIKQHSASMSGFNNI